MFARASAPRRLFADRSAAEVVTGSDGMFGFIAGSAQEKQKIPSSPHHEIDNPDIGTVPDIMVGPLGWPRQRSADYFSKQPRNARTAVRSRRWNGLQLG